MVRSLLRFPRRIGLRGLILVLVLLFCAGLVWFNFFRTKMIGEFFATMKQPAVAVSTTVTKPGTWTPEIRTIGTLWAVQGVDLASQTSGMVKDIAFTANQKVAAGDLLVQIDDAVERADLMSAEASLDRDRAALKRAESLRKTGVNSAATLEDAQSALAASESAMAKIQAVLDQKAIEAPFAGTAGIPRVELGQYVQPGTVIATLQRLDTMRVDFTIPEQQVEDVRMGQAVTFGLTEERFPYEGEIVGIDPKIDPATRLVSVRAELENPDGELRPGQFVRVRVQLPAVENVIALPQTALVTSLYGDYVYAVVPAGEADAARDENGLRTSLPAESDAAESDAAQTGSGQSETAEPAPAQSAPSDDKKELVARQIFVTAGRRQGDRVEIAKGLEPGQQIVTSGQNKLSNNTPVTINNDVDPAAMAQESQDGAS